MTNTTKRINVTVTTYQGDAPFPEAEHYDEFVAKQLADRYAATVECSYGLRVHVSLYGFGEDESTVVDEIASAVKVDLWDDFCSDGYKAFTDK